MESYIAKPSNADFLNKILENKLIAPVYQPIVSLADGDIFGYEALSRISDSSIDMNVENMFKIADKMNKSWELETLCRTKALKNAKDIIDSGKKLFLNVNPNIIYDAEFRNEFTKSSLDKYGLDSRNVVFEITERTAILDNEIFLGAIKHYRKQNYIIAIDDVGSGYSGLNVINDIKPNIMKLDMNLVRNVDKDESKQFLCKAMTDFGNNANIMVIAEGIETEEELKTLIRLNVGLGQGYFLGFPNKSIIGIDTEKVDFIKKYHAKKFVDFFNGLSYPAIENLSKKGTCFSANEKSEDIYDLLKQNNSITEFTVVEDDVAIGFMTKMSLVELFSGRYGYSLYSQKNVHEIIDGNFLRVNCNMPIDQVSRIAMQRPFERLYDPIVIEQNGKYMGIVTVKDLLDASTKIKLDIARHSNPLTGLPGNLLIEKEIVNRIFESNPYCIIYFDIDHFRAYNDAYGFKNGDIMLTLVSNILKSHAVKDEFIGHIGGDRFIVICDYHDGKEFCKAIINDFSLKINSHYREEDIENGYIISMNKHGVTEKFSIATLSIAGISNRAKTYQSLDDFLKDIAYIKKKCKKQQGNYFEIL